MGLFSKKQPQLSVAYTARGAGGGLDQLVTMTNPTDDDLVPTLRFRPLTAYGQEIPGVTVTSVQGLDRGMLKVPARSTARDLLRFDGPGCRQVCHVQTEVLDLFTVEPVSGLTIPPTVVMVDLDKLAVADPENFWGIGVANDNEEPMRVRVSVVELEPPHTDRKLRKASRQPVDWGTLEGDVLLEPKSHDVVWLPDEMRGRYHAVLGGVTALDLG
ncbi:MAG: hypothetical protein QM621_14525 [Aeromicrobium sp.]|uniref:hypothetical protein n=1 Tax=Aeromicrobium sp. TaxID=1871063 RepID=UPI0039E3D1D8